MCIRDSIRGTIAVLPSLTIGSILGIMGGHLTAMAVGAILGGSATRLCVPLGGPILHTMAFLFGAAAGALLARLGPALSPDTLGFYSYASP